VGKISDALDKFQHEHGTSKQPRETRKPVSNKAPEIQNEHKTSKQPRETRKPISNKAPEIQNEHRTSKQKRETRKPISNKAPEIQKASVAVKAKLVNYKSFNSNLVTISKPQSFEAEQFRMLKSQLLFPASSNRPRSIMVTSALPGEGKSFVSANLAASVAQNINEYVLLVDCDIRKPTIHKNFGIADGPGLSDYLSSNISLSSLLLATVVDKLKILPGGRSVKNPAELLSSQKMSELFQEIASRYNDRYIIVDSPPPKLTSETSVLAKHVDGILLVVRYRSTPRKLVQDLTEMIGKEKIIGVVLNKCDFKSASYDYNRYGKYTKYYESY
jgi:exopolysaccharide/PEP-CTERM locus tyrosine autokinase